MMSLEKVIRMNMVRKIQLHLESEVSATQLGNIINYVAPDKVYVISLSF